MEIRLPLDALPRAYNLRSYRLIDDTVAEMGWWYCFKEGPEEEEDYDPGYADTSLPGDFDFGPPYESRLLEPGIPYEREVPKIGRNDPCPCGSGKKFKKCCGGG
jgi:hypothetical protein